MDLKLKSMRLPTEEEVKDAIYQCIGAGAGVSLYYHTNDILTVINVLKGNGCFDDWRKGQPKENGHYRVMFEDSTLGSAYFGWAWNTAKNVVKWRGHEG